MKTFRKPAILTAALATVVLLLAGCTGTVEPEPISSEANEVATAYTDMVEETFNHNLTYDDFSGIQDKTQELLGADGSNYTAAMKYLPTVVPLEHVYVDEDINNGISDVFQVLSLMVLNTYEDKITAEVDLSKVKTDGTDTASIGYDGVVFSSTKNAETGMADYLNQSYEQIDGEVTLKKVDGEWKVDATTVVPVTSS